MNVADPRFDLLAFRSGPVPHDLARLFLGVFSSTRRALGYLALRALHCQVSRSGLDGSSHAGAFTELVLFSPLFPQRVSSPLPYFAVNDWFIS